MTTHTVGFESMVDELLALLDREISTLQLRCRQMHALHEVVIGNDDARMAPLLEEMTKAQQDQAELDEKLHAVRGVLARLLGLPTEDMKLAMLAKRLTGERQEALQRKHGEIIHHAERLKIQHLNTALVLSEAARLNRLLLEGLFPRGGEVRTYGVEGERGWRSSTGLVDAEM